MFLITFALILSPCIIGTIAAASREYNSISDNDFVDFYFSPMVDVALTPMTMILESDSTGMRDENTIANDLNQVMSGYFEKKLTIFAEDMGARLESVSLIVTPTLKRRSLNVLRMKLEKISSSHHALVYGRAMQGTISMSISGSATFESDLSNATINEGAENAIDSAMSDESDLLDHIKTNSKLAFLQNMTSVSVPTYSTEHPSMIPISGYSTEHPSMIPISGSPKSGPPISVNIPMVLQSKSTNTTNRVFGFGIVGVAGLSLIGWGILFRIRRQNETDRRKTSPKNNVSESKENCSKFNRNTPNQGYTKRSGPVNKDKTVWDNFHESGSDRSYDSTVAGDDDAFGKELETAANEDQQSWRPQPDPVDTSAPPVSFINAIPSRPPLSSSLNPVCSSGYSDIPKTNNTSLSYSDSNCSIPHLSQTDEHIGIIAPPSPQHSSNITCNTLKALDDLIQMPQHTKDVERLGPLNCLPSIPPSFNYKLQSHEKAESEISELHPPSSMKIRTLTSERAKSRIEDVEAGTKTRSSKLVGGGDEENYVLQYQELDNNDDNGPPLDNYEFLAKEVNHDPLDLAESTDCSDSSVQSSVYSSVTESDGQESSDSSSIEIV